MEGWGIFNSSQAFQQGLEPQGGKPGQAAIGAGSLFHPEEGMMGIFLKVASRRRLLVGKMK